MKQIMEDSFDQFMKDYKTEKEPETLWQRPIIGYASAFDPLFKDLNDFIAPGHYLPRDLLSNAKSVMVYFIPFHEDVVKSNLKEDYASRIWAKAYVETNELIDFINLNLKEYLKELNINCALIPPTHNFDTTTLLSSWSHRHAGYIAGLGKFGINHMLITEKGCTGRLGSLILDKEIVPDSLKKQEFCLFKKDGTCGTCISRCVTGALSYQRFDKQKCYQFCLENAKKHENLGLADVCGKCVVNLPCSFKNPSV